MKSIKVSASVVAAAFLSGCGGGSSDMISVPAPSAFATAPTATSEALLNGQLLPTRSYSLQQDTSNSAINPSDLITNIRYNKQTQEIAIEMDGNTRTIDVSGSDSDVEIEDRYVQTGSPFTVFLVFQNDLKEFEDGNAVLRYVIPYRNYGVIGAQTPASYLEQNTATATYTGGFMVQNWVPFSSGDSRHQLFGDSSIDVDFTTLSVTGGQLVIATERQAADDFVSVPRSGTFNIGAGSFNNPELEFTSPLTANLPGLTPNPGATIKGGFYGDAAQEIGGALQYQGVLDGKEVIAAGPFTGTKY